MKLLIVDDEPTLLETIEHKFRREGFTTFCAESAEEGMSLFKRVKPDLIVLDIMLPKRSGLDLCRAVRKEGDTPIIFLSARAEEADRVKGFEVGGDDYVVKPFNLSELVARVRAVLRRSQSSATERIERGDLVMDPSSHSARLRGEPVELSPKEFALLYFLAKNVGQVFSRETLLDRVWGRDAFVSARTIDVHVRWLRQHIEDDPNRPKHLITIRGIGYKFAS